MNLIAMRQADELRTAGRPSGVEQRAHGVAIGGELKLKGVMLCRKRRIEADHLPARIAVAANHQDEPQRRHALDDCVGFLPNLRIVRFGRDHQHFGVLCDQQIGNRICGEQIVDRAGNASDLGSEQRDLHLR